MYVYHTHVNIKMYVHMYILIMQWGTTYVRMSTPIIAMRYVPLCNSFRTPS